MGYNPHPGQVRLHVDTTRFRTCTKGRRGGGTTAAAAEIVAEAGLWSGIDYADIGLFAATAAKIDILWRRVHHWLVEEEVYGRGSVVSARSMPGNRMIEMAWGCRVMGFSLDAVAPGEGYGWRLAVIDEAQLIPYMTYLTSIRPAMTELKGRGLFVGKAAGSAFRKLSENGLTLPDWKGHRFKSWDNPIFDPAEAEEARREMPAWLFEQEFEAEFTAAGTGVFDRENVLSAVDGAWSPGTAPGSGSISHGWDLARKMDETVGITLDYGTEPFTVVAFWGGSREPWPVQADRINRRHAEWQGLTTYDATGVGDALGQFLDIPHAQIVPYIFGSRSKSALLINLQGGLEHGRLRLPPETRLIDQLIGYEFEDRDLETDWVMGLALAYWGATAGKRGEARVRWLTDD